MTKHTNRIDCEDFGTPVQAEADACQKASKKQAVVINVSRLAPFPLPRREGEGV